MQYIQTQVISISAIFFCEKCRLRLKTCFSIILIPFLYISCSDSGDTQYENTLFTRLSPESTGVHFSNEIEESEEFNILTYRNIYNGGGVALGDINNNGLLDIYFTSNQGENRLYLNEGNFQFRDITGEAGVAGNGFWSTGVAMADVNGDGLLDIYVLNSGDIFGDNRRNELFINQGDLTFTEEAANYNLDSNGFNVHAVFFDFDGDGDLDVYLLNNSLTGGSMTQWLKQTREDVSSLGGDKLLRNDDGVFIDVTEEAGIYRGEIGFGLGIAVGDVNGDLLPDIYISNDFWERDYLYMNRGDGTFEEELIHRFGIISQSSMGNDIADINNDGFLDIYVSDMLPEKVKRSKTMGVFDDFYFKNEEYYNDYHYQFVQNTLQLNNGNGTFREVAFQSGVAATDWSWSTAIFDFNNDGWRDIFVTNGIRRDIIDHDFTEFITNRNNLDRLVLENSGFGILDLLDMIPSEKIKNFAFLNNRDQTFTNMPDSLGFFEQTFSNGAAYGDLNNDGTLDLVINNHNEDAFIYRNDTNTYHNHHYLRVKFEGDGNNTFGIGAHVKIFYSNNMQIAENIPSRIFQSTVPPYIHFGLGRHSMIDSLKVIWPDHQMQVLTDIEANQEITLNQKSTDQKFIRTPVEADEPVIKNVTSEAIHGDIHHNENNYNDYDRELLLPERLSTAGPALAYGDINGNGLNDLLITGALNDRDKVFLQQSDGRFSPHYSADLEQDSIYESTAAAFVDLDTDGHPDLLVANGSYQTDLDTTDYKLRAYQNDGNGNFKREMSLFPGIQINASVMIPDDIDNNGRSELFIGGRAVPGAYGKDPRSYLLKNAGNGKWIDITPPELQEPGMITDAVWTDLTGNGFNDLILVGDWMPVTIFVNEYGSLKFHSIIENSNGLWKSIKKADLNDDGNPEFILGNWGLNSKLKASPEKPITLYLNDFDQNGKSEFIITSYMLNEDQSYPFHSYQDLIDVFPFVKEEIGNHHEYAGKTYEEIFSEEQRKGAVKKEIYTLHSSILVNDNGNFVLKELPFEAQVSPVYAIIAEDLNDNSQVDLLLMGNKYHLKPEIGRKASNYGVVLYNNGNFDFTFQPYHKTNLFIKGEVRDAISLDRSMDKIFIIARNNDELLMFE